MPTTYEMIACINNYCRRTSCAQCVIENHSQYNTGHRCYSDVPSHVLEERYNLVMQATRKSTQTPNKNKGEDIMVNKIITEEEKQELLTNMKKLLGTYNYIYTTNALTKIIDTWAANKADLIVAFKKHPNYVDGQFMIAFDKDYERIEDKQAIVRFVDWLLTCPVKELCSSVPTVIREDTLLDDCKYLPRKLYAFLSNLLEIATREISVETAEKINEMVPEVHAHPGQKTTRVINKLCTYLGYNKHPMYNKEYAKYADALSPLIIKRHTALSINPLDYLTMSFGNSWASCHTIDKTNRRGMPNNYQGCYSSGTISYMLDSSSMVFYTVDTSANGNNLWDEPKINRQMFHYGEDKLVQGRLYPQDNDSTGLDLYNSYRQIVQEIMATILDKPNLWSLKRGVSNVCEFISSDGTHYRDYENYSNCTVSIQKETNNLCSMNIGYAPICVECGYHHNTEDNINCCHDAGVRCADCGAILTDEDDEYYVNGETYCRNCVSYCESCQEYHRTENHYIAGNDIYVCDYCFEEYYDYCDNCHETYHIDNLNEDCLCECCAEELAADDEDEDEEAC